MTQEQKAKAYDEALERAKSWAEGKEEDLGASAKSVAEFIFPELRESEDERIRKLLVWQVYRNIEDETNDLAQSVYDGIKGHDPDIEESIEDWKKCLAYLDKQKYDRMQPVYDNLDSFESALAKAWKAYNDSGSRTVDGCEDDYVECAHAKGFREGYLFGLEKQKEPDNLEEAARHVYESWMGGTMDDVRRDMVELGKVLTVRKEEGK